MSPLRNTPAGSSRGRRIARVVAALGIAVTGALAGPTACSDAPAAPQAMAPSAARVAAPTTTTTQVAVNALTRLAPLAAPITVSARIGSAGGSLSIPEAGLHVNIPSGLVRQPVVFTVTARPGSVVAYEFGPAGHWTKPITISQKLQGTSLFGLRDLAELQGAYYRSEAQIDDARARAVVDELRPTTVDRVGNKVVFTVDHFSGYMVAWGRNR